MLQVKIIQFIPTILRWILYRSLLDLKWIYWIFQTLLWTSYYLTHKWFMDGIITTITVSVSSVVWCFRFWNDVGIIIVIVIVIAIVIVAVVLIDWPFYVSCIISLLGWINEKVDFLWLWIVYGKFTLTWILNIYRKFSWLQEFAIASILWVLMWAISQMNYSWTWFFSCFLS